MVAAVTHGREGTAMMSFEKTLSAGEISAVVEFVRFEFMRNKNTNTKYHSAENGWNDHEKYRTAFPFAMGDLSVDTPWETLTDEQKIGLQIFVTGCITCHDRSRRGSKPLEWSSRPLSYPRQGFSLSESAADVVSGATPYSVHDEIPSLSNPSPKEKAGEQLFQKNCAFCHAADGTGKNWIGSFLESHPRNLQGSRVGAMSDAEIVEVIRNGVPGTTMSAWRSVLSESEISDIVAYVRRAFIARVEK